MNIKFPNESQIPKLRLLWKEAFGDSDDFLDSFFTTAFGADRCICITEASNIVAALYWFDCVFNSKPIAYIYAVATAKESRGRGLCSALMKYTHNHMKGKGYEGAILVPGSASLFEFYKKFNYEICSYNKKINCFASENRLQIEKLDSQGFISQRKNFLPENSVIQENENISFLETMYDYYLGDDFLLVGKIKGDALFCVEYLGDTAKTSDVLNSLGCKRGSFICPGDENPFSMYCSLRQSIEAAPSYFAFAFN